MVLFDAPFRIIIPPNRRKTGIPVMTGSRRKGQALFIYLTAIAIYYDLLQLIATSHNRHKIQQFQAARPEKSGRFFFCTISVTLPKRYKKPRTLYFISITPSKAQPTIVNETSAPNVTIRINARILYQKME